MMPKKTKPFQALSAVEKEQKQKKETAIETERLAIEQRKNKQIELDLAKNKKQEEAQIVLSEQEQTAKKEKEEEYRWAEDDLQRALELTQPTNKTIQAPPPKTIDSVSSREEAATDEERQVNADKMLGIEKKRLIEEQGVKKEDIEKKDTLITELKSIMENRPQLRKTPTPEARGLSSSSLSFAPDSLRPSPMISARNKPKNNPPETALDLEKKHVKQLEQSIDRKELMNKQLLGLQNSATLKGSGLLTPSQIKEQNRQAALKKTAQEQTNPSTGLSAAPCSPQLKQKEIAKKIADVEQATKKALKQNKNEHDNTLENDETFGKRIR